LNPWVAVTHHAESIAGFWPGEDGEDLPAAQVAIWMAHVLMLKETKSATKQLHIQGEVGMAARGVPIDTDVQREFPEGVSSQVVDMSMDTTLFTRASDHILGSVGPNYGLSMESLKNGGVQSAEAREAMKEPLRHIRRKQIVPIRRAEHRLVRVIAKVLEVDAPDLAFDVVAFRADFGEPQVLQSEMERLVIFEKKRAAGLDNSVDFYRRENPDVDENGAIIAIARNIAIETKRNELMRPLQAISGSLGADVPDGGTDNDNTPDEPGNADPALAVAS
jgi:hypothetical protein